MVPVSGHFIIIELMVVVFLTTIAGRGGRSVYMFVLALRHARQNSCLGEGNLGPEHTRLRKCARGASLYVLLFGWEARLGYHFASAVDF